MLKVLSDPNTIDLIVIRVEKPGELPKRYRTLDKLPERGTVYVYSGHDYVRNGQVIGKHRIIAQAVER
jgi:hypothetical protein